MLIGNFQKTALIILLATIYGATGYCQENPDNFQKMADILPPPPNAAAIAKAALFNLNKNTGAPSINIPLYTLTERKLSVPVSISYNSNGIKVDEIASRVGMGWSLNAGGVITRTVRGKQDELNQRRYPWATIGENWSTYNYMKAVSKVDNANVEEGEPDLFTFSFNGQSGSFVFDESMNIVQVPFGNLKIESNFTSTEWNFKITDASGIIYYFGGNTATEKSKRTTTCGKSFDNPIPTAWYLKKIQHLNGDEIIFYYQPITYSYDTGISETMYWGSGPFGSCQGGNTAPAVSSNSICKNKVTTYGVTLESIRSDDQRITFIYDATRNDCNDALLTEVRYIDPHQNVTISKFTLDYSQTGCDTYFSNAYSEGNSTPFLSQWFSLQVPIPLNTSLFMIGKIKGHQDYHLHRTIGDFLMESTTLHLYLLLRY